MIFLFICLAAVSFFLDMGFSYSWSLAGTGKAFPFRFCFHFDFYLRFFFSCMGWPYTFPFPFPRVFPSSFPHLPSSSVFYPFFAPLSHRPHWHFHSHSHSHFSRHRQHPLLAAFLAVLHCLMAVKSPAPLLLPWLLFRLLKEICVFMDFTVFGPLWFLVATYLRIPPT